MKPRLLLHIGTAKTGTTALQLFFTNNKEKLDESGFHYVKAGFKRGAHHAIARLFLSEKHEKQAHWIEPIPEARIRSTLLKECDSDSGKVFCVSSEVFSIVSDPSQVASFFSHFDVQIILFLRRQDLFVESLFRQLTKTGNTHLPPFQFFTNIYESQWALDYRAIINRWSAAFGESNIVVIPFDRGTLARPLSEVFFELTSLELPDGLAPIGRSNTTFSCDALAYLQRLFPKARRVESRFRPLMSALEKWSAKHPDPPQFKRVFSPEDRIRLLERFRESNEEIARRFLPDGRTKLFDDPPPEEDEVWKAYPGLRPARAWQITRYLVRRCVLKNDGS